MVRFDGQQLAAQKLRLHDASWVAVLLLPCRYDAGDNVKFNFPMAWSAHVLAWSIVDFADVSDGQICSAGSWFCVAI